MRFVIARFASGDATRSNGKRIAELAPGAITPHARTGNAPKLYLPSAKKV
ncbi:hypothetical protein [Burkholderia sp. Bp9031]|nr:MULTISPECIES: hypothetical protein [Burkholderia]